MFIDKLEKLILTQKSDYIHSYRKDNSEIILTYLESEDPESRYFIPIVKIYFSIDKVYLDVLRFSIFTKIHVSPILDIIIEELLQINMKFEISPLLSKQMSFKSEILN